VDIWGRVRALSELGHEIDLVATVKRAPEAADLRAVAARARRIYLVDRVRSYPAALGLRSFQVASRKPLARLPLHGEYDAVLLESELVAPILENPALRSQRVVVRVHNDEASFSMAIARSVSNPALKAFHMAEAWRVGRTSRRVFDRADRLWFISRELRDEWAAQRPESSGKACWLPAPIDLTDLRRTPLDGHRVLFVGNLVAPTNVEAINWYLRSVHPRLLEVDGYEFTIAGALLGGSMPRTLELDPSDRHVRLVTDAPNLSPYYEASSVFVNPMRNGGGVKLKTLNAVAHGLPVVTTAVGNAGTGFVDGAEVLVRDSADAFSRAVRDLLLDSRRRRELAAAGQAFLLAKYDHKARLATQLGNLAAHRGQGARI
jgi:glycosyltransferase involved in cell wall biosynthesis